MATAEGLDERRAARTDAIQSHADEASEPETGGSEMGYSHKMGTDGR